jgi:hypothetical protein
VGLQLPQVEVLGKCEARTADLHSVVGAIGEHQKARRLRVDLRLRSRRRSAGDQLAGATEPREGRVVAAGKPVALREQDLRLCGALEVALGDHPLQRERHQRLLASLADTEVGPRVAQHEGGPLAVLLRGQLERPREELHRGRQRAQGERPLAGIQERAPRGLLEAGGALARRAGEIEGGPIVVREELRAVLGAVPRERIDPLGCETMFLSTAEPRDLCVRHVAHQQMPKRILGLARHRAAPFPANELLALECVEPLLDSRGRKPTERPERTRPEHLADHRRVLEQELLLGGKAVEACRDDPLHRFREPVVGEAAVAQHANVLLGVERVPARSREQRGLHVGVDHRAVEQQADQPSGVCVGEWPEGYRCGVRLPTAPARAALEQFGPRGRDEEQRHATRPLRQVVDEIQEALVRPVEVLEDEHGGPQLRERLEEPAPCRERLAPAVIRIGNAAEPEQRAKVADDPVRLRRVLQHGTGRLGELRLGHVR